MAGKKANVNLSVAAKALGDDAFADDAFVRGSAKASRRHDVASKVEKRRMTIYLPTDVALALEMHGVKVQESVSGLVERAVRQLLNERR